MPNAKSLVRSVLLTILMAPAIAGCSNITIIVPSPATEVQEVYSQGEKFYQQGDIERAITFYNEAIELDPDYARAYMSRGSAYDDLGQYDQALEDLNRAVELEPENAPIYVIRGVIYRNRGELDNALADYENAFALGSDSASAYAGRGKVYYEMGEFQLAVDDLNKAFSVDPFFQQNPAFRTQRGYAFNAVGDYRQAKEDLDYVLDQGGEWEHSEIYLQRAMAHGMLGDNEHAIADLQTALKLSTDPALTQEIEQLLESLKVQP